VDAAREIRTVAASRAPVPRAAPFGHDGDGRAAPSGHGGDGTRTSLPIPQVTISTTVPFFCGVVSTAAGVDFKDLGECVRCCCQLQAYSTDVADQAVGMLIDVLRRGAD
jgi:hypothetical protein